MRGQTFYGGNNPVVANTLDMWGYWIFPDGIPGEKKAVELARTMSEYDLDIYYYRRGLDYVKAEWFSMPRLLLGKLVRAYVPIPWKPNVLSYGVGAYRAVIYLLAVVGMVAWWRAHKMREARAAAGVPTGAGKKNAEMGESEARCSSPCPHGRRGRGEKSAAGDSGYYNGEERSACLVGAEKKNNKGDGDAVLTRLFTIWFAAMILTCIAGVLIFWGCFRFAFVLEPLLIPFAAMGTGVVMGRRYRAKSSARRV